MKKLIAAVCLLLAACAASDPGFTDSALTPLSGRVAYAVDRDPAGYTLTVEYHRFHYRPPKREDIVREATGEFFAVPSVVGLRAATPPAPETLRVFTDRDRLTGIEYCTLQGRFIY